MKNRNKYVAMLVAVATSLAMLAGCSAPKSEAATFQGVSENGKNGKIVVEVAVDGTEIKSVTVLEHQETEGLADPALERIPAEIVEKQSLAIDAVSGATITSVAILEAAENALAQAGFDIEALKASSGEKAEKPVEELSAQVVIVGGGATGMAAAVSSAQNGAESVILLEKTASLGGNAIVSGGFLEYISAPDELRPTTNAGYAETIEYFINAEPFNPEFAEEQAAMQAELKKEYEEYLASGSDKIFDSKNLLALDYLALEPYSTPEAMYGFATLLDDTTNWLTDLGMEWKPITGIVGYNWPRWTSPKGSFQGHGYFDLFNKVIEENNYPVDIMLETAGQKLIVEDDRVVGITAEGRDKIYNIRAEKGVVLATGGFAANIDMCREYNDTWEELPADIKTTNASGMTGDGIVMAQEVGAVTEMMGDIMLFPNADPIDGATENIVGNDGDAMYVNKEGVRFVDETLDRYSLSGAILEQTDHIIYIISDEANSRISNGKTFNGFDVESMIANGQLYRADTLEELAEQLGMDPATLVASVEKYNASAANYMDEEFGRNTFSELSAIDEGPFYACPRTVATHITGGGLLYDERYCVLDTNYEPIEGLYAGGEVTAYMSGISSFGDGMYIGQILFGE